MTVISSSRVALDGAHARLVPTMPRVAAALAGSLLADSVIRPGVVDDGRAGRDHLLPGPGARAVSASLDGALRGTLVLVVSAPLAEAIEHGPLLEQELVPGVTQALTDAVAVLEQCADGPLRVEAALEVDAAIALGTDDDGAAFLALTVLDGSAHVATLALLLREAAVDADGGTVVHQFEPLVADERRAATSRSLDLLADVEMGVTAELGRTRMTVKELLALTPGAVVELDRTAGSPVDVLVNGTLVARGEVVVIDEEFGVRISEIVGLDTTRPRPRT